MGLVIFSLFLLILTIGLSIWTISIIKKRCEENNEPIIIIVNDDCGCPDNNEDISYPNDDHNEDENKDCTLEGFYPDYN